jgi:DNA adenine methylase
MNYPGGKNGSGTYQRIINLIPPHRVYIETHLGSGAVLRNKKPARRNFGIDLNFDILHEVATKVLADPQVLYDVYLPAAASADRRVRACIVDRAGAAPSPEPAIHASTTGSDDTAGTTARNDDLDDTAKASDPSWRFYCMDSLQFLKTYQFRGDEFVYADPPYVMGSRRNQRRLYQFEYDDADHVELLDVLKALPCQVMISGYQSDLYADHLAGWNIVTFDAITRGGSMATEYLWMNYDQPVVLHDFSHLGDDYRQRERIKRKADRLVEKFRGLDETEALAILSALLETKTASKIVKSDGATRYRQLQQYW